MRYSIKVGEEERRAGEIALAQRHDVNSSYKDLCAVCDAVRHMQTTAALSLLGRVMRMETAIEFRRHNKHMGSRHELAGRKGKYPRKASNEVRLAILNAMANAENNGNLDADKMYIVHASSNKTRILRRNPSKGSIAWGRGMYGRSAINHSDIEYAKIEIAIANEDWKGLTPKMRYFIEKKRPKRKEARQAPAQSRERSKPVLEPLAAKAGTISKK